MIPTRLLQLSLLVVLVMSETACSALEMKKPGRLMACRALVFCVSCALIRSASSPEQDLGRDGHIGPHATTGAGLDHGKHSEQRTREPRMCQEVAGAAASRRQEAARVT